MLPGSEIVVRDVEGDEDCQTEQITFRGGIHRRPHLLVDERGKLGDVPLVETAADRIALSGDFDRDYAHRRSWILKLDAQVFQLIEHIADARANHLAFAAKRFNL